MSEETNVQPEVQQTEPKSTVSETKPVTPEITPTQSETKPVTPETVTANTQQQSDIQINVDQNTHMAIALQDFDRKIAEAEVTVANLKRDKANYIYETNVKILIAQAQNQQNQNPQQG